MRTLEVFLNGKKLCTAGVGEGGVLTTIISALSRPGKVTNRESDRPAKEELRLEVGGFVKQTAEHLSWCVLRLRVGDDIRIRIGDAELASKPIRRERADPASVAKAEEKYLADAAKRLGWEIVKQRRLPAK